MKPTLAALLTFALSLPALAQSVDVRFIPPAPDSRAPVTARMGGMWPDSGYPRCAEVSVSGLTITIVAGCRPQGVLPAVMPWSVNVFLGLLEPGRYDVVVLLDSAAGAVLGRSTLLVHDATAAFRVVPNVGIASWDVVRIVAPGLFVCNDTVVCAPPVVRFGDREARFVSARLPDEIVVQVPDADQPRGTVDVSVEFADIVARVGSAFHYADTEPADPAFFMPVLVPVFSSGPGARGSRWETELSLHNDNDFPLTTIPGVFTHPCFPACDARLQGRGTSIFKPTAAVPGWFVVHLPRQYAENVHFDLLVRDLSQQAEALGTEIPVVREHELYDSPFGILNVPIDRRFRVGLRLYSLDGDGVVRLVIRSIDFLPLDPFVDTTVNVPGSLLIGDLVEHYADLIGRGSLSIEIIPERPTTGRFWGFAAVTNNDTQHVTVISPQ